MTALCALVLADRGELDLDAPVAKYWPEFAAEGKGEIPVRSVLGHTSGLAGWTERVTLEDMYDLDKSCDLLARQAPWWKPGTASGYHTYTIGHLVHSGVDLVLGGPVTWGLGYALGSPWIEARMEGRAAGHRWAAWGATAAPG